MVYFGQRTWSAQKWEQNTRTANQANSKNTPSLSLRLTDDKITFNRVGRSRTHTKSK